MKSEKKKKTVKEIRIDLDKCIGCRACEVACSAYHAKPRYSSTNPARSRIRVIFDALSDVYVPIRAGDFAHAECTGRHTYSIHGKVYKECSFCGVACPAREYFKEPDSGLPLKCDMCESDPPLDVPMCVKVCGCGALSYAEREVEVEDGEPIETLEVGLESMARRFGWGRLIDTAERMSRKA